MKKARDNLTFVCKGNCFSAYCLFFGVKMKGNQALIHVYCMPGTAAKPTIFEHIKLPKDQFEIHWLSWKMPKKKEPVEAYAKRMCEDVKHDNVVLIGVSFGGVIVQEMQKFISVKRLVLISTVKTKYEIPMRMKIARNTKLYKILPTGLAKYFGKFEKYPLGKYIKNRLHIYNRYMGVSDKRYLDWAFEEMLLWDRETPLPNIVHIHGDNDIVFPIENIKSCIVVKGGTHLMIINRFRWFNQHLPGLILLGKLSQEK